MTDVLTTGQIAIILRVSLNKARDLCRKGEIASFTVPGCNHTRATVKSVRLFMKFHGLPMEWLDDYLSKQGVEDAK